MSVFQQFYAALNAKQIEQALGYVADEAIFAPPLGRYVGKTEVRRLLNYLIQNDYFFEFSNVRDADGKITATYKVWSCGRLADQGDDGVTIVKDGQIIFDGVTATAPVAP
jgi:hypothetical protein